MYTIFEKKTDFTDFVYWDKKTGLTFGFGENCLEYLSVSKEMPEGKKVGGKKKDEVEQKFVNFVMSKCRNLNIDGYEVEICKSAAGYYAGCYCEEGPYCRLSWYGNDKIIVAHWMYFNKPEEE